MKEKESSTSKIIALCNELPNACESFLLETGTEIATSTRLAYARELKYFFEYLISYSPAFCDKELKNFEISDIRMITSADISRYLTIGQSKGAADRTLARRRAAISRFFTYLADNRKIEFNPVHAASKIKIHTDDEVVHLDLEEQVHFLESVETGSGLTGKAIAHHERYKLRDIALITFLLDTGMRVSEVNSCDIKDIDFDICAVHIIRKGGNKQTIYFSDETRDLLQDYIDSRKNKNLTLTEDEPLFVTSTGSRLAVRSIQDLMKKYSSTFSCAYDSLSPHKMRSSFAMAYYEETKDILALQKKLGHKNLSATNIYAKATDKKMRETRDTLSNKRKQIKSSD